MKGRIIILGLIICMISISGCTELETKKKSTNEFGIDFDSLPSVDNNVASQDVNQMVKQGVDLDRTLGLMKQRMSLREIEAKVQETMSNTVLTLQKKESYTNFLSQAYHKVGKAGSGDFINQNFDLVLLKSVAKTAPESLSKTGVEEYYYSANSHSTFVINRDYGVLLEICDGTETFISVSNDNCYGVV